MILPESTARRALLRFPASAVAALLLLHGCASAPPPERPQPAAEPQPAREAREQDRESLLIAAERTGGAQAALYRLDAAALALEAQRFDEAERILAAIPTRALPAEALPRFVAAKARLALGSGDAETALNWLQSDLIQEDRLALSDQIAISTVRAEAYRQARRYLSSARERIYIDPLLPPELANDNHRAIWDALMELPARTLANEAQNALTSDLRGWLSLTALSKQSQGDIAEQLEQLKRWRQLWPNHPAAAMLPDRLTLLGELVENKPSNIALFLPLRGDLAPYGKAVRDGFLGAYYASLEGKGAPPEITVYDTTSDDLIELYNRALADGVQFIIGPLDRERVERLGRVERLPIPVLALNRLPAARAARSEDLFQFSLAPEDEVLQVADQAWREGLRRALVIAPDNDWGQRTRAVFEQDWLGRGGEITGSQLFTTQNDYSDLVQSLLAVDLSEKRATELRRIIREPFEFDARRRQDIDFIVLLASPSQARGINPTLAFFYAEDLPVYATSHINDNAESRINFVDLNGIRFCDIPWKLTSNDPIQLQIQHAWGSATRSLAPFLALGVDAFRLYPRVRQFMVFPSDRLFGSTGVLRIDENRVVYRRLMWAQIRDGEVLSIPLVVDLEKRSPPG